MSPRIPLFILLAVVTGAFAAETKAPAAATPPPATSPAVAPASTPAAAPAEAKAPAAQAKTTPAEARKDSAVTPVASFDSFRLITDRNIFNPNRTGARRDRATEEAPPKVDVIALVGTSDSNKGLRAFFDGSASTYRKTLRVGDAIDQFKVTQITPHVVDFERDGKTVSLKVGQELRRPDGGDWNVVGEEAARRDTATRGAGGSSNAAAKAAEIPANADPVLKQMMERRQKQLKQ